MPPNQVLRPAPVRAQPRGGIVPKDPLRRDLAGLPGVADRLRGSVAADILPKQRNANLSSSILSGLRRWLDPEPTREPETLDFRL